MLTLGAYGNLGQKINATQDILRETFYYDDNFGDVRLDSVSDMRDVKGKITCLLRYTVGFVLQKSAVIKKRKRMDFGRGFFQAKLESSTVFTARHDSVRNKWEVRVGGQINPVTKKKLFQQCSLPGRIFFRT